LTVYAYPRLSKTDLLAFRIGGAGLGNLLLTWARCRSASHKNGWQMIWPTWPSIKPKNLRVNPYDVRFYGRLFKAPEDVIAGVKKPLLLLRHRWRPETEAKSVTGKGLIQFFRMADFFEPFLQDRDYIQSELIRMTRPEHLKGYHSGDEQQYPIGIHIRLGDFVRFTSEQEIRGDFNTALPLDWYIGALAALRKLHGADTPARVFSDGNDDELTEILRLPNVTRADYGSAIADMLALSRSRILVTSGSTFSMWASWLGQMPALWYPDKKLQDLNLSDPAHEIEWLPGQALSPTFNM